MNPKASLKSRKTKVRAIASRPATSVQPGNPARADFRASADSRSAMTTSVSLPYFYPNTGPGPGSPETGHEGRSNGHAPGPVTMTQM